MLFENHRERTFTNQIILIILSYSIIICTPFLLEPLKKGGMIMVTPKMFRRGRSSCRDRTVFVRSTVRSHDRDVFVRSDDLMSRLFRGCCQ